MGDLVGYRFQPKDVEIISLLNKKTLDPDFSVQTINEVNIYNFEPSELPRLSAIQSEELVWYFFCAPYYKNDKGTLVRRRTKTGYWKVTGQGCKIFAKKSKDVVGKKKFLVFCEHGNASKKHKAEWVMHEFRCEYNRLHKKDFVICRIERKTKNKPKISTCDDGQSSHHLASNILNHVEENIFSRVESQQLPSDDHMTSNFRNHVAENTYLRVEPQQLPNHMPFDSRNHVAENTPQGVENEKVAGDFMISTSRNHVAENTYLRVEPQQLPSHMPFDFRNHVAENTAQGVENEKIAGDFMISTIRNHVAENTYLRVEPQQPPSHIPFDSRNHVAENTAQGEDHILASASRNHVAENISPGVGYQLLSYSLTSDDRNHVAENNLPTEESQLIPSHHLASNSTNHVVENISPWVESQQLPSQYLISDFRDQATEHIFSEVEPMLLAQFDAQYGYNQMDYNSFPALQSPTNTEHDALSGCNWLDQGSFSGIFSPATVEQRSSSYSDGFSNNCNALNFQFDSEQEDVNSQWAVHDKCPLEETGHALPLGFNSVKIRHRSSFWGQQ